MMNEVLKVIKSRRSIRKYSKKQISQENLDLILEAGIYAPTAHNDQPWHFTVIQKPEMLARINAECLRGMAAANIEWMQKMVAKPDFLVTYDAPTLIVVSGRVDASAWETDCAAAIENMIIAAASLGIGSVWLGLVRFYFNLEGSNKELGIPEGYKPSYGVAFGYGADEREAIAPKRRTDVVNYIR